MASAANRRRPEKPNAEPTTSCNSSTSPAANSDWAGRMLPWTPMSAPGCALRSRITCATGPEPARALFHWVDNAVEVRT
jgi:hypothetical protein